MAEPLVELGALLALKGQSEFEAGLRRTEAASKKVWEELRRVEQAAGKALLTTQQVHFKAPMQGAAGYADKLQALNRTTTAYAAANASAAASATRVVGSMQDAGRAARGLGAAFGGLGKFGPVVEAMVSPAGAAALAIGGLVAAIVKLRQASAELDKMDIASQLENIRAVSAGTQGAQQALNDALINAASSGETPSAALLLAIEEQGRAAAALGERWRQAAEDAKPFITKQEDITEKIRAAKEELAGLLGQPGAVTVVEKWSNSLKKMVEVRYETIPISKLREEIVLLEASLDSNRANLEHSFGATRNFAAEVADAAEKVFRLKRAQDDLNDSLREGAELLAKTAGSLADSMTADRRSTSTKLLERPGTATSFMSVASTIARAGSSMGPDPLAASGMLLDLEKFANAADNLASEMQRDAAARMNAIVSPVLSGAGLAGSLVNAGATGGPAAILAQLLAASDGFQNALKPVNETLQRAANAFGSALDPITPLLEALSESLEPIAGTLQAWGPLLTEMNPMFVLLNGSLRLAAGAANILSTNFINASLSVLRAIKALLPDRLEPGWLDDSIRALKKLKKSTDDVSEAFDSFASILPEGYKLLALRAYEYSPAVPASFYGLSTQTGSSGNGMSSTGSSASSGGDPMVIHGDVVLEVGGRSIGTLRRAIGRDSGREATVRTGRAVYSTGAG